MPGAERDPYLELLDDGRDTDTARRRRRRRWLEQQAVEGATLTGVLLDLAEVGTVVLLTTTSGHRYSGAVRGVGGDVVVLDAAGGRRVLVALSAVASVGAAVPLPPRPAGDRTVDAACLVDLLAEISSQRGNGATLWMGDVGPVRGVLSAVGIDVVAVAAGDRVRYVPVAAISEVLVGPDT